jgi:hypothetical protein
MVPQKVVETVKTFSEPVVVFLKGRDHLVDRRRAIGRMPTHVRAVRASLRRAEVNATLLKPNEQSRQFSSAT